MYCHDSQWDEIAEDVLSKLDRLIQIYVSAITQLNIDDHHRMSTSNNRLLRRIVKDYQFRGYSPDETLDRWLVSIAFPAEKYGAQLW